MYELYKNDPNLNEFERAESMLDEILHDQKVKHVRQLKTGDMFGEQAIIRDCVRTASVRCTEDTHLAYITRDDFQKVYRNIAKAKQDKRQQFLKAIPLF